MPIYGHHRTLSSPGPRPEARVSLAVSMRPHGLCDIMSFVSEDTFSKVPHWFIHRRRQHFLHPQVLRPCFHPLPHKFQSLDFPQTVLFVPSEQSGALPWFLLSALRSSICLQRKSHCTGKIPLASPLSGINVSHYQRSHI